jgi:segregation and condensation protein B
MSLKAKLEAVIYAAEEPVTLAQFASLFAEEALALKAAQDAESIQPVEEAASPVAVGPLSNGEAFAAEPLVGQDELTEPAPEPVAAVDSEAEAKRLQRVREREVREILRGILDELIAEYAEASRGIEIREIAGGFRMGTKPEIHDAVRAFAKSLKPALKLSLPALETLAVIAYKQPVTAPEVGEIRGVDSGGVLGSLMSRKLIATAGRKQVIGRPMLYKTTKEFLLRFGLKDLNELPSMEEFEKMAALELSDGEEPELENQTGDLFATAEATPESKVAKSEPELEEDGPEAPVAEVPEASTPTAEPSEEAAEAQALVERLNAEEIEANV